MKTFQMLPVVGTGQLPDSKKLIHCMGSCDIGGLVEFRWQANHANFLVQDSPDQHYMERHWCIESKRFYLTLNSQGLSLYIAITHHGHFGGRLEIIHPDPKSKGQSPQAVKGLPSPPTHRNDKHICQEHFMISWGNILSKQIMTQNRHADSVHFWGQWKIT